MWVTRREIARLERELKNALQRATDAEERLQSERASKDWMIQQLTSRVVTKHGGYGLDSQPLPPAAISPHAKGFIREPEEVDAARLQYYVKCYREAGKSEDDAQQLATNLWEKEMRGESVTYDYEQQEELIG